MSIRAYGIALRMATVFASLAAGACGAVRLTPGVPIVVSEGTPAPVRLAVEDLRRDLEKVLGAPSPVVPDLAAVRGQPAIVILTGTTGPRELHHAQIAGREAHGIHAQTSGGAGRVVLEGADLRGAIYAIYSFSDEFLGVPPLWYWANWTPERRPHIDVPTDQARIFPPAYVRWRAWFNNDTDFLTPWRSRAAANNAAVYETILRLKYNTYELGSIADLSANAPRHAPARDAANASARGLILTGHHVSPVGSSLGNWDAFWRREGRAEPPPLSVRAPENLAAFWRYHIETAQRSGFEMVWTIVFRGARDIPFWETFPDAPAEMPARARVISDMLHTQVKLVKEITGDLAPPMRTTLYNEGSTLFAAGLLRPPEEPTLIWNFVAARRDHFPAADLLSFESPPGRLLGYYLNFQFTSTGSHLAAAEGPWKMAANFRTVDRIGKEPLAFTVVNAGNIREHLTELSANADMMWRFREFDADEFLRRFCARYFGEKASRAVAALYRDYYHAYWTQKPADLPGFDRQYIFQDMRYARAVEMLLKDVAAGVHRLNPLDGHPLDNPDKGSVGYFRVTPQPPDADQIAALLRGTAESGKKFAAVAARTEQLVAEVAPAGRGYLTDNLLLRARLMTNLNTMLHETVQAYRAPDDAKTQDRYLRQALAALTEVQATLDRAEHGPFAGWYRSDRVFGIKALETRFKAQLEKTGSR